MLEATLEATRDAIMVVDLDRNILCFNRRYLDMFGFTADELERGGIEHVVTKISAELETADAVTATSRAASADPSIVRLDVLRFTDGRVIERFVAPLMVRERIAGRTASFRDISAAARTEDQLRQSQKMEAIGRLAGGIAHDLNNALTAIAGYAELALGEVADDHAARADVEEIRRAAERAGSVTRQLLAFSRKQLLEPRVFDLNETIAAMSRLLSRLLGADIDVQTRLGAEPLPVLGDPGQVEQAVINLAVNARDAMTDGGRIVLSTAMETVDETFAARHMPMTAGRYIVLRVSDSGQGMSRETQARIFEPFFTTKDVGKGTGLGLSMVYGTVKQIGGFIFVESSVGQGTTFALYFPPAKIPARETTNAAPDVKDERHGHETLLIVEDEPSVRNLVASALRHDGYHLLIASSAEEALELSDAHAGPIDLLLTDAMMPGKSGVELSNLMTARRPGIPIIIMSGYTEETLAVPGLKGPLALLQKPFTPRELRRRIREVFDR